MCSVAVMDQIPSLMLTHKFAAAEEDIGLARGKFLVLLGYAKPHQVKKRRTVWKPVPRGGPLEVQQLPHVCVRMQAQYDNTNQARSDQTGNQ